MTPVHTLLRAGVTTAFMLAGLSQPNLTLGILEWHNGVGLTPKPGDAQFSPATGEYRITGGGANMWAAEDAFHFAWKRLSGDATLTADVSFVGTGVDPHRKAVLVFRQDLTPGSIYADAALHGDGLTSLQFRPGPGKPTQEVKAAINIKGPGRLRLERRGNRFTLSAAAAGGELAVQGAQTVEMTDPVYVGLGVCSHNAGFVETAVFSNVTITQAPPQPRFRSKVAIYDLNTRTSRVVYRQEGIVEAPNWSRDGSFLLVNTGGNLYRLPTTGTEAQLEKINLGADTYRCNNDHDLSRDGQWLGFSASSPQSRQSQVYVAKADGSGVRLLTPAAPSYFHGWSPDGKWLAFVGQRNNKYEIYRVPFAGGAEQRLTAKGAYDDGPEYSPDGKWIYFNSNRSGGWDIWRIPAEGGGPDDGKAERVTSDEWEDWFPHISPNGKQMIFLAFPKGTTGHNDRMEGVVLRIMPTPGKSLKTAKIETLTTFFGGQGTINVNSWSPDSTQFAYVIYEPSTAR